MSLHISYVFLKGQHKGDFLQVMKELGYQPVGKGDNFALRAAYALDDVNKGEVAICEMDGWTLVYEPDMVIAFMDEELRKLSEVWRTTVFAMGCVGSVGSFWFSLFDNGKVRRKFSAFEGDAEEDLGEILEVEKGKSFDWLADEDGIAEVTQAVTGIHIYSIPDFVGESSMAVGRFNTNSE